MKELTKDTYAEFISSESKVLVDFWATWCGPCMRQGDLLHKAAEADPDFGAKIGKVNVDDERELAISLGIQSIPTLIVFSKGAEVKRFIGLQDVSTLKDALN